MKTAPRVFDEINITPLTDVFLVLLIIMMVVAPMMFQQNQTIKPPEITSGQKVNESKLIVEITKDGQYFVMGKPTDAGSLKDALAAEFDHVAEKNVVVRADKETKSSAVLRVFEAARDAKFEKITVAGEPLNSSRQSDLESGSAPKPALDEGQ